MDDRSVFDRLERRWVEANNERSRRLEAQASVTVRGWRATFTDMIDQQAALQADGRWVRGHADLMGVLGLGRSELIHSAALQWLLDPLGAHGLGAGLLRQLFQYVDAVVPPDGELVQADIRREVVHPLGRADLLIDVPGTRIVIENKIDADEQPAQARRMVEAFDTGRAFFVYLTLHGGAPVTAHGVEDRWVPLSYRTVATWLDDLTRPVSGGERLAARAYLATIERIAGGTHRG